MNSLAFIEIKILVYTRLIIETEQRPSKEQFYPDNKTNNRIKRIFVIDQVRIYLKYFCRGY